MEGERAGGSALPRTHRPLQLPHEDPPTDAVGGHDSDTGMVRRSARRIPGGIPRTGRTVWLVGLAAAVLLSVLAALVERAPGDRVLTNLIQDVDFRGLDTISASLFPLGLWPAYVAVGGAVSIVCWCARQRLAAAFAMLALLSVGTSTLLKLLIERPRPTEELVRVIGDPGGFSFPSGHVLGAVLLWGFVFYMAPQILTNRTASRAVRTLALVILVLMGLQRIHTGAHWPSDVVGGYLWGALILAVIIRTLQYQQQRHLGSGPDRTCRPSRHGADWAGVPQPGTFDHVHRLVRTVFNVKERSHEVRPSAPLLTSPGLISENARGVAAREGGGHDLPQWINEDT